eukprot:6467359-Prymnesium_polylepis.1
MALSFGFSATVSPGARGAKADLQYKYVKSAETSSYAQLRRACEQLTRGTNNRIEQILMGWEIDVVSASARRLHMPHGTRAHAKCNAPLTALYGSTSCG